MSNAYAKVRGEELVKYPYGFDDLQAEFTEPLSGDINFEQMFAQSPAAANGFSLVEVSKDTRKRIPLPPGQQPVFGTTPVLMEGAWILPLVGLENPPPRPNDGKHYVWNMQNQTWYAVTSVG